MVYTTYEECLKLLGVQCSLQCGDDEDITEEEMKLECFHYKKCKYSQFYEKKNASSN